MVSCLIYHDKGYESYKGLLEDKGFEYQGAMELASLGMQIGIYEFNGSIREAIAFGKNNGLVIEEGGLERFIFSSK